MKLDVGAIVYIIDPKNKTVVPAQVQEQLVSITVKGEKVSHNVQIPSGKIVCIESLNASFFKTLEEVRTYLLEKAEELIDSGIKSAEKVASEKFSSHETEPVLPTPMLASDAPNEDTLSVTLEDGTKANIKLPTELLGESISN